MTYILLFESELHRASGIMAALLLLMTRIHGFPDISFLACLWIRFQPIGVRFRASTLGVLG